MEARRIARRKELLGVGALALPAHLDWDVEHDVELTVVGPCPPPSGAERGRARLIELTHSVPLSLNRRDQSAALMTTAWSSRYMSSPAMSPSMKDTNTAIRRDTTSGSFGSAPAAAGDPC